MTADYLRRAFIHSLVPIAAVYVLAHYLTYFVYDGQRIIYLVSDPFGQGWDLFGTATRGVDYSVLSQNSAWYLEVAFVVSATSPRSRSRTTARWTIYGQAKLAVRSQYWMLGVMVGFTSLALWLLVNAGK